MTRAWIAVAALGLLPALGGCSDASGVREARAGDARSSATIGGRGPRSDSGAAASGQVATPADLAASGASRAPRAIDAAAAAESPPGGIVEATFDDVKFPMEKTERFDRSMLTEKVHGLFGKRIRIRGYMYPTLRKKGLTQFVLVRDNMECCFGPGAALFDCILVTMAPGRTAEYSIRPIAVEGAFRLEELPGPDGRPLAIYQMVGEGVTSGG
ncbi:MAG: DUF3299 domain-containing protein [Pirellulales bacterium]|nr:DUF3299 domain-containing protein [Pirellulales bacterium]